jgi:hypothetical protein
MQGNETVKVKRPVGTDWQGDPTGDAEEFDLTRCQLWPRSSTEDSARGRVIIEGWNVYVPAGRRTVLATDVVEIRGEEHLVVGKPGAYDMKGRDKGQIFVTSRTGT